LFSPQNIRDKENYVLTDQNHNSMALLYESNADFFFRDENDTHAILLLREKLPKMEDLLDSQVECIPYKRSKFKEKFNKIKSNKTQRSELFSSAKKHESFEENGRLYSKKKTGTAGLLLRNTYNTILK